MSEKFVHDDPVVVEALRAYDAAVRAANADLDAARKKCEDAKYAAFTEYDRVYKALRAGQKERAPS